MPTPSEILQLASAQANDQIAIAILWHVALAIVIVALWRGWRPSRRVAGMFLTAPIASVSLIAFEYGNPFTGIVLGLATPLLLHLASRLPDRPLPSAPAWARVVGALLIAFGWMYPHFLHVPALYLIAAPFAVVPCPTLAVVVGFSLLAGGLGSRAWMAVVAILALFYGVVGVMQLHVWIDVALVVGGFALAMLAAAIDHAPHVLRPAR
ncbi:MAG TPA: hypothetical protein VFQ53_00205 [Kofleriaceae bacterium]|nr:hypothetical protein [Kofleriaceae bacterium]